ncbi:unnamed protein product, partial [Sphacelaria rigidula]
RSLPGSGKALYFNRILSIPHFVWRTSTGQDDAPAVAAAAISTAPSAPPMSPGGSSGSVCSTASDSSAKIYLRQLVQPVNRDNGTKVPHPVRGAPPLPPPTPPKPTAPTFDTAAAAASVTAPVAVAAPEAAASRQKHPGVGQEHVSNLNNPRSGPRTTR